MDYCLSKDINPFPSSEMNAKAVARIRTRLAYYTFWDDNTYTRRILARFPLDP